MTSFALPISVRLATSRATRRVGRDVRSLVMSAVDPGGFESADITIDRPLDIRPLDIAPYGSMTIEDTRTSEVLFEGEMTDPGRGVDGSGQLWNVVAVGGSQILTDDEEPHTYISTSLDKTVRFLDSVKSGDAFVETNSAGNPCIKFYCPQDTLAQANVWQVGMRFPLIRENGQRVAAFNYTWDAGVTDTGWHIRAITLPSNTLVRDQTFSTVGGGGSLRVVVTNFPATDNEILIQMKRETSDQTVGNSETWVTVSDFYQVAQRLLQDGSTQLTGYGPNYVTDLEVVKDILGRLMVGIVDTANAVLPPSSYSNIDQLEYVDGANGARIMQEIIDLTKRTYAIWEKNSSGLYRFEYRDRDLRTRYYCGVNGGFSSPSSTSDLYDRAKIRYKDAAGNIHWLTVTQMVPSLGSRHRTKVIDLGDEAGSTANATGQGQNFLSDHAAPPNAGALTLTSKVYDSFRKVRVDPWMVKPGYLIEVDDIAANMDSLNPNGGRDGDTVFYGVRTSFDAAANATTLDLDASPVLASEQLANLRRNLAMKRRR